MKIESVFIIDSFRAHRVPFVFFVLMFSPDHLSFRHQMASFYIIYSLHLLMSKYEMKVETNNTYKQ